MALHHKNQKGFTLVEIALVLVIIGVLITGVLKGQELILNAKIKTLKKDADSVAAAIYGYQGRYKVLPGDDPNASLRGAASNGDSNAMIETSNSSNVNEVESAWLNIRNEGFIEGTGSDAPVNKLGGDINIKYGDLGLVVCLDGLTGDQMEIFDIKYDDVEPKGDYQTLALNPFGVIGYVAPGGPTLSDGNNSLQVEIVGGELCLLY